MGREKGGADRQREQRRQTGDGERHHPPEPRDIDEEGRGDPVHPGEKEAEAEEIAEAEGCPRPLAAAIEPQNAWEDDEDERGQIDGRQRRRGERAEQEAEPVAAAARQQRQLLRRPAERRLDPRPRLDAEDRRLRHWRSSLLPEGCARAAA
jgi:hypothetical protein